MRHREKIGQSVLMGRRSEMHVEGWRLPAMPAQEEVAGRGGDNGGGRG
jgi:hypothetical protein